MSEPNENKTWHDKAEKIASINYNQMIAYYCTGKERTKVKPLSNQ